MNSHVEIHGKPVRIELSRTATTALRLRTTPLIAEMRLLFSCMVRKEVCFLEESAAADPIDATQGLVVRFHPIVTRACALDQRDAPPRLEESPAQNAAAFVPQWLRIDYRAGEWRGEFGYG
jgi:hypothetical protein